MLEMHVSESDRAMTDPSKADFVSKIVETTDAIFGVFEVVIFDETESVVNCQRCG